MGDCTGRYSSFLTRAMTPPSLAIAVFESACQSKTDRAIYGGGWDISRVWGGGSRYLGPVANVSEPLRFPAASGGEVETGSAWSCLHTQARMRRDVDSSRPKAPSFLQRDDPPGGTGISRAVASEAAGHKAPQRREEIAWGATGHWARSCRNIAVFEWLPGSRVPRTT